VYDEAAIDDLVFDLELELLVFFVPEVLDHVVEVSGIHQAGMVWNHVSQRAETNNFDAILCNVTSLPSSEPSTLPH
jgi:hypothetical protein